MSKEGLITNDIIANVGKLFSANLLVQLLALAVYPVLSRFFSPADFGLLALFLSVGDIVGRMSTLSLEEAVLLPKRDKEAYSIVGVGVYAVGIAVLLTFLFVLFNRFVVEVVEFSDSFFLLPVYVFVVGLLQLCTFLFNRYKLYKEISFSISGMGVTNALFRLGGGFLRLSYVALIASALLSQMVSLAIYAVEIVKKRLFRLFIFPSYNETKRVLVDYRQFPRYVMTRNFLNSLSGNLPFFMLIGVFGSAEVGLYSMAFTLAFRPVNVFSGSVYRVLFEKFSDLKNRGGQMMPIFAWYLKIVFAIALPAFLLAGYFAEQLFGFILGAEWISSGSYFRIILPWIFMVLLSTPLASIALVFAKQKYAFWIDVVYLFFRMGALSVGIFFADMPLALGLFSASGVAVMMVVLCCYFSWIKSYDKSCAIGE